MTVTSAEATRLMVEVIAHEDFHFERALSEVPYRPLHLLLGPAAVGVGTAAAWPLGTWLCLTLGAGALGAFLVSERLLPGRLAAFLYVAAIASASAVCMSAIG